MSDAPKWRKLQEDRDARALIAGVKARPLGLTPPFSRALGKALQPILKVAGPSPGTLAAQWPEIVGPRLAALTHPIRVQPAKGGATLHVRAASSVAPLLQHAQAGILERVRLATGYAIVRLAIDQTAASAPKPRRARARLSDEARAELKQTLAGVRTPALGQALEELGEAVLAEPPARPRRGRTKG